jgi:aminoglycoside 3'-phosphotransferase-2
MDRHRSTLSLAALSLAGDWKELAHARIEPVTDGMSGAELFCVSEDGQPVRYLKIARNQSIASLRREIERTQWLSAQGFRVPAILRIDEQADQLAMLTQAVPGMQAQSSTIPPDRLMDILARGMAALHRLPPASCPFDESLSTRLSVAEQVVAAGDVEPEHFEHRNHGITPEMLLQRLKDDRPTEDTVVIHGDATLTNLIVDADGGLGFVDCGNAGRGDRYIDLAVLYGEIEDHFGDEAASDFIRAYGLRDWDAVKARYFSDLYELF